MKLFKGKKGQAFLRDMVKKTKTFTPGAGLALEKKVVAGAVAGLPTPKAANGINDSGQQRQDVEAIKVVFIALGFANRFAWTNLLNVFLLVAARNCQCQDAGRG